MNVDYHEYAPGQDGCRSCGSTDRSSRFLSLGDRAPLSDRPAAAGRAWTRTEPRCPAGGRPLPGTAPWCRSPRRCRSGGPVLYSRLPVLLVRLATTLLKHSKARTSTEIMVEKRGNWGPSSLVVELASNDGYLLQYLPVEHGVPVLGIDPAEAPAPKAASREGHPHAQHGSSPWKLAEAAGLRAGKQRRRHSWPTTCWPTSPDTNGFLTGIAALLKPGRPWP